MSIVYTGKYPWDVIRALSNQGVAYDEMQAAIATPSSTRSILALIRVMSAPVVFCVIPLAILRWKELMWPLRGLAIFHVICIIVLAILRGTDRENADLLTIAFAAGAVTVGRAIIIGTSFKAVLVRFRLILILGACVVCVAGALFLDRKLSRYESVGTQQLCMSETCADMQGPLCKVFGEKGCFSIAMASAYMQGYYGFSVALAKLDDFHFGWGFGHSPVLMSAFLKLTGDQSVSDGLYSSRLRQLGWDDRLRWSTLFIWLANDVSFEGVPFVMLALGALFALAWRDAVFGHNDPAAVVVCFFAVLIVYMPANNQIALVPDHYFGAATWLSIWLWSRFSDRTKGKKGLAF